MVSRKQSEVIRGVRMSLENFCDSVETHSVDRGENQSLHLELDFASPSDELTTGDVHNAISEIAGAYWGAIRIYPDAFDRAVIDFPSDGDEDEFVIRYELPTQWVRQHVEGDLSEAELIVSVHESAHVIDEDGVPRSGEEYLEAHVDDVDAVFDDVVEEDGDLGE